MALGSTQPLVKMSTRNIHGGTGGRCVRLTTYHHTVPLSRNLGALTSLDTACYGSALPLPYEKYEEYVVLTVRQRVTEYICANPNKVIFRPFSYLFVSCF